VKVREEYLGQFGIWGTGFYLVSSVFVVATPPSNFTVPYLIEQGA